MPMWPPSVPASSGRKSRWMRCIPSLPLNSRAAGTAGGSTNCLPLTAHPHGDAMNETTAYRSPARFFSASVAEADPELAAAIGLELGRQQDGIELIASENIVSRAVMEAQGSVLTNKYAEGYPGRRYYGGCEFVDIAENLAIE